MAFNIPNQTSYILQRPQVTQTEWTRPADWITITDTPGEVQFLVSNLLLSAYTLTTTFDRTLGTQNIYIDWGDGTTDTVTTDTSTNTSHTYTTAGTPCSRGYDTYKIRVYVDSGATITICNNTKPATTTNPNVALGLLEAYFGDGTLLNCDNFNFDSADLARPQFTYLEYVKLPSSLPILGTFDARFRNCRALAKIVMPTSADIFNCVASFYNCSALQSITFPSDATNITSLFGAFFNCFSLTGATLPTNLDSVTTTNSMFTNCASLSSFQMPSLASCTDYTGMFEGCYSLITMNIPNFTSGATTGTTASMFNACAALEYIKLPTTVNTTSFVANNMFTGCSNLKSIILPTNFNASTLASTFTNCVSLSSIILPTSMSSLTSLASTFSGCFNLQNLTLPTTVGATIIMSSTFQNCRGLSSIVIPSGWTITSLASTFILCNNLTNVTLPTAAQNSITSMASTFNGCSSLTSVTLPSSMTSVTLMTSTFNNCSSLTGVTFPTTMNAVTNIGSVVAGCSNLQSLTLPTSMSSLTTMVGAFQNCFALKSVTLPATISASFAVGILNLFSNCYSLETVTLPTTQTTVITNIASMFINCFGLKTVNNTQYLGNPSTSATIYVAANPYSTTAYQMTSADFYCKFSTLSMNGSVTIQSNLTSLRLRNNGAGQYGAASPQINISYTSLDAAALDQVFTDLPTVTSKTINITGASGTGGCDRTIATAKGWTVTG